ncbi:MAG: hypothetical protein KC425_12465 [Anaerolineales bacterium]|nr:hypothetical protein [Anaerolineales bacterium]
MNSLHEVVYQIAANPSFLSEIAKGSRKLLEQFNLSQLEANVVRALVQDQRLVNNLLNVEAASASLSVLEEQIWVPPQFP